MENKMTLLSLEDSYEEIFKEAGNKILRFTIPLFRVPPNGKADKIASAVCLEIGKRKVIATASHVFKGLDIQEVGAVLNDNFFTLSGKLSRTQLPEDQREDTFDVCLIICDEILQARVVEAGKEFYSIKKEDVSDHYKRKSGVLILGWPNRGDYFKVISNEKKIRSTPFRYGTKIDRDLTTADDIVVDYNRNNTRKEGDRISCTAPYPEGLSGCGIWHINSFLIENPRDVQFRFCGILRQYPPGSHKIFANKTRIVVNVFQNMLKAHGLQDL